MNQDQQQQPAICPTCQQRMPKTPPEVRAWMRERWARQRAAKKAKTEAAK